MFDSSVFGRDAISAETQAFNEALIKLLTPMPDWWVTGPRATREARARGEGPFPRPVQSPRARQMTIPGKAGPIVLRIIDAEPPRGVYLHIHGGGWVLGASDQQDPLLERVVDQAGLTSVSVE